MPHDAHETKIGPKWLYTVVFDEHELSGAVENRLADAMPVRSSERAPD